MFVISTKCGVAARMEKSISKAIIKRGEGFLSLRRAI